MEATEESLDYYAGKYLLNLSNDKFKFPDKFFDTYRIRNGNYFISYQCFFYPTEHGKLIELYDPHIITKSIENLDQDKYAGQIIIKNDRDVILPNEIINGLGIEHRIVLHGDNHLINLWNPEAFEKYEQANLNHFDLFKPLLFA